MKGCVALVGEKSCPDRLVRMCGQPVTIGKLPLCEDCRYQFDRIFLGLREAEIHLFTHALVMSRFSRDPSPIGVAPNEPEAWAG